MLARVGGWAQARRRHSLPEPMARALPPLAVACRVAFDARKGLNMARKIPFQAGERGARTLGFDPDAGRVFGCPGPGPGRAGVKRREGFRKTP